MKLQPFQKRTRANIDLDAAEHNFSEIRSRLNRDTKLCCVVKANGCGHGAVRLSKPYEKLGADEYGRALAENAQKMQDKVKTHILIDTGMGRIGFRCDDEELEKAARVCLFPGLFVEGIFTHFASAGIFDYPEPHPDMVRAGVVLSGLQPSTALHDPGEPKPILTFKTITDPLKSVPAGAHIGYGRECTDQCMMDVSDISEASVNSKVTVYGVSGANSVDAIANANHTINYEIVCALGECVPRVYKKDGATVAVVDNIV